MITQKLSTKPATRKSAIPSFLTQMIARIHGPATYLRAKEDLDRFRSLDPSRQRDIGVTQKDLDAAKLADFLDQPRR